MARTVDLRGKLGMAERPQIETDFGTLTIIDNAYRLVQVMDAIGGVDGAALGEAMNAALHAAELLFDADSYALVQGSDLTLDGLMQLINCAADIATGGTGEIGGEDAGEAETPATT